MNINNFLGKWQSKDCSVSFSINKANTSSGVEICAIDSLDGEKFIISDIRLIDHALACKSLVPSTNHIVRYQFQPTLIQNQLLANFTYVEKWISTSKRIFSDKRICTIKELLGSWRYSDLSSTSLIFHIKQNEKCEIVVTVSHPDFNIEDFEVRNLEVDNDGISFDVNHFQYDFPVRYSIFLPENEFVSVETTMYEIWERN